MNHRNLRVAIALSFLIHASLILFFLAWRFSASRPDRENEVTVTMVRLPEIPAEIIPPLTQTGHTINRVIALPKTTSDETTSLSSRAVSDTLAESQSQPADLVAELFPRPIPLVSFAPPALPVMTMPQLPALRGNPGAFTDRAGQMMSGGNQEAAPQFDVSRLFTQGLAALDKKLGAKAAPPLRLKVIPSVVEMAALCVIWEKGTPTEAEIYRELGADIRMTAEDLHGVLAGLVEQGLLQSEIISPRLEFTFMTPVGGLPIEMSSQNRRNRVFRYESRIDAKHMMSFLQAAQYQANNKTIRDSLMQKTIQSHIQRLLMTKS